MSYSNEGRVKMIRKKASSGTGFIDIPLGTNGIMVDMLTDLNLEEELKIGGSKYSTVEETPTSTTIKEWYLKYPREDYSDPLSDVLYSCSTTITTGEDSYLVDILDDQGQEIPDNNTDIITDNSNNIITDNDENQITTGEVDATDKILVDEKLLDFLIVRDLTGEQVLEHSTITIILYKGDMDNGGTPLYQKQVEIYNIDGQMSINEKTTLIEETGGN